MTKDMRDRMLRAEPMTPQEILDWRNRLDLTQEQVGALFGVSWRTISNYENGLSRIPFTTYVSCLAFENVDWFRKSIPGIIARRRLENAGIVRIC